MRSLSQRLGRLTWWESRAFCRLIALVGPVLAVLGSTPQWNYRTGYARQQLGHDDRAATYYQRALDTHEHPPVPWNIRLAQLLQIQGREGDAVQLLLWAAEDAGDGERAHRLLLAMLEDTDLWDEVLDQYGTHCRSDSERTAQWAHRYLDVVRAHPRVDRAAALEACTFAARVAYDAEVAQRCAEIRLSHGDTAGALEALRRAEALEGPAADLVCTLRVAVANALRGDHQYAEACALLRETTAIRMDHGATFRKLGQVALDGVDWHGLTASVTSQGRPADPNEATLSATPFPRATQAEEFLALACWSLEHAIRVSPKGATWHALLGRALERRGYWEGAAATYDRLTALARKSTSRNVLRSLHEWEFRQERAYHHLAAARVADPLFSCSREPIPAPDDSGTHAGIFRMEFTAEGARIQGHLTVPSDSVRILLDGRVLREERVGGTGTLPGFRLNVRRGTLSAFPATSTLTATTTSGRLLAVAEGGTGYTVHVPHGDGSLVPLLKAEHRLDKKGGIAPTLEDIDKRQDQYLDLYDRVRTVFDDQLGRPCFILYGTLLGLHRDGDFIPSDDDFDCGYISDHDNPSDVKEDAKEIIRLLLQAGFVISFNPRGRLFRITDSDHVVDGIHLDARPIWFEDGMLWMHNHVRYPSTRSQWLPAATRSFRHIDVYVPNDVEHFLEAHYGPGWRTPDPSFTYYKDEVDPAIHAHLEQALITPGEYRQWKQDFEETLGAAPAANFISLAEYPLYPLTSLLD